MTKVYHTDGSLRSEIERMYAVATFGGSPKRNELNRRRYVDSVKLCEKLEKALRELLADSDRWINDGCIIAMPGTRSYKAREQARKLLKLKKRNG